MCHTGLSRGEQGCRSPRSSVFLRHRHSHPWVEMGGPPGLRTNLEQKDLPAPRLDLKCGQDQPLWIVSLTKCSFSGWHTPQEPRLHTHTHTPEGRPRVPQEDQSGGLTRPPRYLWDPPGTWPEASVLSPDPVPEALDDTLIGGYPQATALG